MQAAAVIKAGRRTRGFTLIEVLVVISIIVVLAGMLVPAVGLIKRKMNWTKAANNMRGLYAGMVDYQAQRQIMDQYPPTLSWMFEPGGTMDDQSTALLLDPMDPVKGTDPNFGRYPFDQMSSFPWANLDYLHARESKPTSFLYELSDAQIAGTDAEGWWPTGGKPMPATATWLDLKIEHRLRGNVINGVDGQKWDNNIFPILRSFWHHEWTGTIDDHAHTKVLNISWNGNVFKSTPWWENGFNPTGFPLP